ncbi:putative exonuclease GOR [Parasteatoda tepidariorum]|uniref:putative exonuclease GOR n=1 Tax=Parasteatoda tepidariorum TaxID=114398 RepID=UPI00077FB98A|nr:putative exonuclease GOR [Parasteatoda tepidariorum]XP_042900181.1 putative exonuclease GOR [Parasteatoda tepidariorum]
MKNSIQRYLNWIPLKSDELYSKIHGYKMSWEDMKQHGYPLPDQNDSSKIIIMFDNMFDACDDPAVQKCRCGKLMSILDQNWYLDQAGCTYHPGKRTFGERSSSAVFSCCGKTDDSVGCAFSEHHVSFHRPYMNANFLQTKYNTINNGKKPSNIYSLDCEMIFTTCGLELAKVTLIDISGSIMYDTYVRPEHQILDYNFEFSGIDESQLEGVTTTLTDVHKIFSNLLNKDTILIGHCLANDFLALNIVHENVVDTACLFPHELGHPYKHSLKYLTLTYLRKNIQAGNKGHNSIEDARSCLELVLWKVYHETRGSPTNSPNAHGFIPFSIPSSNLSPPNSFTPTIQPNGFPRDLSVNPDYLPALGPPIHILMSVPPPNRFPPVPPTRFISSNLVYLPFNPALPCINFPPPLCRVNGPLQWWPFWRGTM